VEYLASQISTMTARLLAIFILVSFITTMTQAKDWSKVDFDELEQQWNDDEDDDNVLPPFEAQNNPSMIFAKVASTKKDQWTKRELEDLCYTWQNQLQFNMIKVICFVTEPDTIIVQVPRGLESNDVWTYLSQHATDIQELTWNGKTINPSEQKRND